MEKTCKIKTICTFELVDNYMKLYAQKAIYYKLKKTKFYTIFTLVINRPVQYCQRLMSAVNGDFSRELTIFDNDTAIFL